MSARGGACRFGVAPSMPAAKPAGDVLPFFSLQIAQPANQVDRSKQWQSQHEERAEPADDRAADQDEATNPTAPSKDRETDLPSQDQILGKAQQTQIGGGVGLFLVQLIDGGRQRRMERIPQ